jgi:hypothetical protein
MATCRSEMILNESVEEILVLFSSELHEMLKVGPELCSMTTSNNRGIRNEGKRINGNGEDDGNGNAKKRR